LAATLSAVASVQDLVSGLAFSLLMLVNFSFTFNLEIIVKTNLFTVFQAVKSECASLMGVSAGPIVQGIAESGVTVAKR
jgi:hypothetical protein